MPPLRTLLLSLLIAALLATIGRADTLDAVRSRGELVWGADREGGGPYVFSDPEHPRRDWL